MSDKISAMRFVYAFLDYVEENGIFDEFDPDENVMVTSDEMQDLINMAMAIVPDRVTNEEAATMMRQLTLAERDALISEDDEDVVIDMRDEFAEKIALNGGARGILHELVQAQSRGDVIETKRLMQLAQELDER